MIELFEHNKTAYDSAVSMLSDIGKAAIIHPTGTGKSFIGFKFCEDHPDKTICWLSPSEYIFKTQLENLAKVSNGYIPQNVRFYTYAKLMLLSNAEISEIAPDFIILDEFHRCGAQEWGKGVENLLKSYPGVPILGLSATNIRYLDNQRDMADELFDGNIASEMTLGEAIVRGILAAPKYVLSVFSYQKDLEKYQARVRSAKSKLVRDEAERYLEALRRALDKADGLDTVFDKHMTDRTGKYIIFCANYEHMQEMIGKAPAWFGKVDSCPHIYTVYSDDPSASRSFKDFKADNDTDHLRLLYCIDALNEGVHVDDVAGVILLRPTVSPIIYKQQIGRALAAGKKDNPVIFDIVLNIENLYSIGAVEEEMQIAMTYYRSLGMEDIIVNEHFQVIDEVRDCIALFDKLNDTLTASWDLMYEEAKRYYEQNGNLEIPYKYKTPDGYSLGHWILTQKRVRAGEQFGELTEERIAKLDTIGMIWGSYRDLSWERNYAAAKAYYEAYGNLNVVVTYTTENGLRLGSWIAQLRSIRKNGSQRRYLTPERIRALDEIGMVWDVSDYLWLQYYSACVAYYRENGNLDVPLKHVTADGIRLGIWMNNVRSNYNGKGNGSRLLPEQIKALDDLGMLWNKRNDRLWEKGYTEAMKYRKEYGNLDVPTTYKTEGGYRLGGWIVEQRNNRNLPERRRKLLDDIGMIWAKPDPWEMRYALAKAYYEEYGNLNVPTKYVANGVWLNKWLNEQRQIQLGRRGGKQLTSEQIEKLNAIGMCWESRTELKIQVAWDKRYEQAKLYYETHGNLLVPTEYIGTDGKRLNPWVIVQRRYYAQKKLTEEQIDKLSCIGMVWIFDDSWETGYLHAERYFAEHRDLCVPASYICADQYALGNWIANQRNKYNNTTKYCKLTEEQIKRLESIGMIWNQKEECWEKAFALAADYSREHGHLKIPNRYKTADGYSLGEWIRSQREKKRDGTLEKDKEERLNAIGMDWLSNQAREWETHFESCRRYYEKYGNLNMTTSYVSDDGFQLGLWLWRIRTGKMKLKTTGENGNQIARLESIGIVWREDAVPMKNNISVSDLSGNNESRSIAI